MMTPNIAEPFAHTSVLCRLRKLYDDIAILVQMHPMLRFNDNSGQILVENRRAGELETRR
jgi:hypothetical protein